MSTQNSHLKQVNAKVIDDWDKMANIFNVSLSDKSNIDDYSAHLQDTYTFTLE